MKGNPLPRVRMAERSKALRSGRSPLVWAWSNLRLKNFMQGKAILRVRMAEWSKALRSGRSPLLWAWVPKTKCKGKLFHMSGWPIGLRRCVLIIFHFCGRGDFFEVKNYMQGKAILRVRMAEWSKALRSGRSPLLWAWVTKTKCEQDFSLVRMADRSKALRLDHIPLLWAWSFFEVKELNASEKLVAAVAEWYRHRIVAGFNHEFDPSTTKDPLRVGQRCTLNLSRAETSSVGVVAREGGCQLRCRPRHSDHGSKITWSVAKKPSCS
ncbi:hypothetical protein TNCV_3150601 [Trichonephila clavipes]|nr:hypothetical protein TNCV_3150601 [Trichonephila clavipes]